MAVADETTGQVDERFSGWQKVVRTETTTSRTIGLTDVDAIIVSTNGSATTFTIPESTATAGKVFPIGSSFRVLTKGAGTVTVAKTGSDTLTGTATVAQNATKLCVKIAATEWMIA